MRLQQGKNTMRRSLALALAAATIGSFSVLAAPQPQRVRGVVEAVNARALTVREADGKAVSVTLDSGTKYAGAVKSSLSKIAAGSYIGAATKGSGDFLVALEVVIFPPSMRGAGDGHYPWDKLPDTTLSGGHSTASSMTNGNVESARAIGGAVDTTMTNGNVDAASPRGGAKRIKVSYKGGEQTILVPPTAPVVALQPGDRALLSQGAAVFVVATEDAGTLTARFVVVGKGVKPPM
jgi:hypothetical protein